MGSSFESIARKSTKKKTVKLTKKALEKCPTCGRPKVKDESKVSNERMHVINDVMTQLDGIRLS